MAFGDNYCTSCTRTIPWWQFFRTWCDACVEELQKKLREIK